MMGGSALGVMMVILLLAAHSAFADTTLRHLAQIAIVLIGYRLILVWLGSQAAAIEREDWEHLDETAHDHGLSLTRQQAFYHLVLSPRDAGLRKKGVGR